MTSFAPERHKSAVGCVRRSVSGAHLLTLALEMRKITQKPMRKCFTSFTTAFLSASDENLQDKRRKRAKSGINAQTRRIFAAGKGVADPESAAFDLIQRKSKFVNPARSATARSANRCRGRAQLLPPRTRSGGSQARAHLSSSASSAR